MKKEVKQQVGDTTESVLKWLKSHELFKWSAMCKQIGLDFGNFYRTMQTGKPGLKPESVSKIISIIKKYGYANGEEASVKDLTVPTKGKAKTITDPPPKSNFTVNTLQDRAAALRKIKNK